MLRIWSWNVNGLDVWGGLVASGVDVVLLQEARLPATAWERTVAPDPAAEWRTAGWNAAGWARRTAVVDVSGAVNMTPRPLSSLDSREPGALIVSRHGTLAAADIVVGDETITLVSMYAAWDTAVTGHRVIYGDAAAHRLLSDLAGIVTTQRSHRVIAAGDLNILHGYGERGDRYWAARYASVFDRAQAMGLWFVGPQMPNGRPASPRPDELPAGSKDVPTYYTRRQGPMGATRQLDFVFCSEPLVHRLTVRALNADGEEWGPSDHCRIAIDLG